jgi:hypothetical protein
MKKPIFWYQSQIGYRATKMHIQLESGPKKTYVVKRNKFGRVVPGIMSK